MNCYKQLVQSKFLAKASEELSRARKVVNDEEAPLFDTALIYNKADRKYIYDCYVEDYMLLDEIQNTFDPEEDYKDTIFYLQEDYILFVYSRSRKLIKEAVLYSYNVHGDIPLHKSKHTIHNKVWFTVLIDTRMPFPTSSPN
tara:strand:+ start:5353 stop:5778 length:426 start_codon:yes stop_codon:yes gene_type:complete